MAWARLSVGPRAGWRLFTVTVTVVAPRVSARPPAAPRAIATILRVSYDCMPSSTTAVVMMDSRDPLALAKRVASAASNAATLLRSDPAALTTFLAYFLNLQFCRHHRAQCLFYRLRSGGCTHPRWGARHPSYCKLAAVAHALFSSSKYELVVFLDSDAFWRETSLSAQDLLTRHHEGRTDAGDDGRGGNRAFSGILASFGWDSPYSLGPNGGFFVLRNDAPRTRSAAHTGLASTTARSLLRVWWNIESGRHGNAHPFEQRTLQWQLMHLHQARTAVETLRVRTMEPNTTDPIVHLDHNVGTKSRNWVMARAVAESLVAGHGPDHGAAAVTDAEQGEATNGDGHRSATVAEGRRLRPFAWQSSSTKPYRSHGRPRRHRGMHRWSLLLLDADASAQTGAAGPRMLLPQFLLNQSRRPDTKIALRSQQRDAQTLRQKGDDAVAAEALRGLLPLLSKPRQRLATSRRRRALTITLLAAVDDLRRTAAFASLAPPPRIIDFDATKVANKYLRLLPQKASAVGERDLAREDETNAKGELRWSDQLIEGMPLFLANVSLGSRMSDDDRMGDDDRMDDDDASDWQRWIVDYGDDGKGSAQVGSRTAGDSAPFARGLVLLRLASRPWLCLSLGSTRAPKAPYAPLAVISRCPRTGNNFSLGDGAEGASATSAESEPLEVARASMLHDTVSGALQTSMRVRTMRRRLPEHNASCGFWPECTGYQTVKAKDCWYRLSSDPHACGASEPTLSNLLRRGRTVRMNNGQLLAEAKPGWRSASIGPAGPLPTAMLFANGADRLCLSRWRSEASEGSAVTFAACPKQRSRAPRARAKAARAVKAGAGAARAAEREALARGMSAAAAKTAAKAAIQKVARSLDLVRVDASPHMQKWRASDASEWDLVVDSVHKADAQIRSRQQVVRIVPRQTAGRLCLAVPRLSTWQDQ